MLRKGSKGVQYEAPTFKDLTATEGRIEFEDDLGRVVFSAPERRLQDKAHVFALGAHDSVRTRLTHFLEFSNVAGDLSQAPCRHLADRIPPEHATQCLRLPPFTRCRMT